jgi:ATP-binding cassette subfamily B protein
LTTFRPGRYALNALLWTTIWAMPIIPGLITKEFFDGLTGDAEMSPSVTMLIGFLFVYVAVRVVLIFVGLVNDGHLVFRVSALLRHNMLRWIFRQPGADAVKETSGEAISRFREDVEYTTETTAWTVDLIGATLFSAIAIVILLRIDTAITLIVFVPLVAVIVIAERAGTRIRAYRTAARESTERITGLLGEMFGAVQSVKVSGAEENLLRHFEELNDERRVAMVRDRGLNALLESVFWNTVNVGTALILILAAGGAGGSSLTVGEFALYVFFLGYVTDSVHFVGVFLAKLRQSRVSFERMNALMPGAEPEELVVHRPLHLTGPMPELDQPVLEPGEALVSLEVDGLTFRYADSGHGIEDLRLRMERGSFTVVTGRIGSGKTTALRALLGLLPAQRGDIRWNGRLVTVPDRFFVPPRTAYTPQVPSLFSLTLRDNLLLGLERDDDELRHALRAAVMEPDLAAMPDGLDTEVGPLGMRLSGGQIQRTAAARMLARTPELLVFDDLSSALDVDTEQLLWERMFVKAGEVTALVVSHRRAALRRADQIVVLGAGRIIDIGSLDDLLDRCPEMRFLWSGDAYEGDR